MLPSERKVKKKPDNPPPPVVVLPSEPTKRVPDPSPPPPTVRKEENPLADWCKEEANARAPLCFVDESGRYSPQGPDYEGQIRRLRTGDGIYFTKFGARKLAHYVEREVQRIVGNKGLPVALPIPVNPAPQAPIAKPRGPAERPAAGPVVPLTVTRVAPEELLGGGGVAPATDATLTRRSWIAEEFLAGEIHARRHCSFPLLFQSSQPDGPFSRGRDIAVSICEGKLIRADFTWVESVFPGIFE